MDMTTFSIYSPLFSFRLTSDHPTHNKVARIVNKYADQTHGSEIPNIFNHISDSILIFINISFVIRIFI